jgi:hypothetical protein
MKNESNWKSIQAIAVERAAKLGHSVESFTSRRATPGVKTAHCDICYGCCWVAHSPSRGYSAGGRILKYKCGTPEAQGKKAGGKHDISRSV